MSNSVKDILQGWSAHDLANLSTLLGINESSTTDQILDRFKWLYHSQTTAAVHAGAQNVIGKLRIRLFGGSHTAVTRDELREMPTYDQLIIDACKHLKAYEEGESTAQHEIFMCQAIVIAALSRMKPRERARFFERQVDLLSLASGVESGVPQVELNGPMTTLAILGTAQASGFAIFATATTALGFLTHAVGVTLPFAVYAGMTSTIAFVIGPAGWLAAGIWGAWKFMLPEWKKLAPALVYVVAINSRQHLENPS